MLTLLCSTDKRRKEEPSYSGFGESVLHVAEQTLASSSTLQSNEGALFNSRVGRESLTNIKPKPSSQGPLLSATEANTKDIEVSTNQVIMSPFRTFILTEGESLFDSESSVWGDVSSFDKPSNTGKGLSLTKLTSPGVTGLYKIQQCCVHVSHFYLY